MPEARYKNPLPVPHIHENEQPESPSKKKHSLRRIQKGLILLGQGIVRAVNGEYTNGVMALGPDAPLIINEGERSEPTKPLNEEDRST